MPEEAGAVQAAAVLKAVPGGLVSRPLRYVVPPYPEVQGSGEKKVTAIPKCSLPSRTADAPAETTAGVRTRNSWMPDCRVTATSEVVSRLASTTLNCGPTSRSSALTWVAASGAAVIRRRRSVSELSSCAAS